MRDVDIVRAAQELIDAPYALCGDGGYDCLSMLYHFFGKLGVELPREFHGFTDKNYGERWENGEGRREFAEYLSGVGRVIDPNFAVAGDIMIFDYDEFVAPGVYLGNDTVLCAYEQGVLVVPYSRFLKPKLLEVRRCLI